jgi:hypothetical protein
MTAKPRATVEDLYHVPENGKAKRVNGELVLMSPSGAKHGRAGGLGICFPGRCAGPNPGHAEWIVPMDVGGSHGVSPGR